MHGHYGPPIGSRPPEVEWSRDRCRHVTPKDQTRDLIILRRHTSITVLDRMVLSIVTMRLSSTVTEIWPFEVVPGRLFQEQRSVVGQS